MLKDIELKVCRFFNNAPCAYSMTYDEGFIHVLANALPIHEKYNFPGHLDVVAGQLGQRVLIQPISHHGFWFRERFYNPRGFLFISDTQHQWRHDQVSHSPGPGHQHPII